MPLVSLELFYGQGSLLGNSTPPNVSTPPGGEQLHPPYGRSTLQPRVLNRWLDVNSQNGPLGRTQTYLVLPAFTGLTSTWNGYSDLIAAFNYTSPNCFSFKELPTVWLESLDFLLCVAFLNNDNITATRYALNGGQGEIIYFPLTQYTNQPILNNFRFEIWSKDGLTPALTSSSPALYTSVLGDTDYRYGLDTNLVGNQTIMTGFGAPIGVTNCVPLLFPIASAFIPQGIAALPGALAIPGSQTANEPFSAVPVIDSQTGAVVYIRVSNSGILISSQ